MTTTDPNNPTWATFARAVIESATRRTDPDAAGPPPDDIRPHGGVFVTLHRSGRLRGCMGILDPKMPLSDAVRQAAISAARHDPRFAPVAPDELSGLDVEVSILSDPRRMESLDDLIIGTHGILVRRGLQRGLFLPQVATEHHFDKESFLSRCCSEKAGLPADAWRQPEAEVFLFTTEVIKQ